MQPLRWSVVYIYLDPVVGREQAGNRPVHRLASKQLREACLDTKAACFAPSRKAEQMQRHAADLGGGRMRGLPVVYNDLAVVRHLFEL